ncbi:hypothetical protein SLG_30560 [Sphingobium sp. SYK-6]|nr:hypothetical protein SLG_30560 [Sphingobium sp. SYK-6]
MAGSGGRLFCFAMQSRLARRREKAARRCCGKTAGFGQISLSKGRVAALPQDHGEIRMVGGIVSRQRGLIVVDLAPWLRGVHSLEYHRE